MAEPAQHHRRNKTYDQTDKEKVDWTEQDAVLWLDGRLIGDGFPFESFALFRRCATNRRVGAEAVGRPVEGDDAAFVERHGGDDDGEGHMKVGRAYGDRLGMVWHWS